MNRERPTQVEAAEVEPQPNPSRRVNIMNVPDQLNSANQAQKGWLSRWTRKQWSRHWFVLKNGCLTYYRGPAAELCSFLDGVLDLSLIKHIEVHQQQHQEHHHHPHHHQLHHQYNYTGNGANHSHANGNLSSHFNFSLQMWNGECHILGAATLAERSHWLEAINACTNGELIDEEATDSASSSSSTDSSPISSNLSIGGSKGSLDLVVVSPTRMSNRNTHHLHHPYMSRINHQQQQQQQDAAAQMSLDRLAVKLKSAISRRRSEQLQQQQDVILVPSSQQQQQDNKEQQVNTNKPSEAAAAIAADESRHSEEGQQDAMLASELNRLSSQQTNSSTTAKRTISSQRQQQLKPQETTSLQDEPAKPCNDQDKQTPAAKQPQAAQEWEASELDDEDATQDPAHKRFLVSLGVPEEQSSSGAAMTQQREPNLFTCQTFKSRNMHTSSSSSDSDADADDSSGTSDFDDKAEAADEIQKRNDESTSSPQAAKNKQKKRVTFNPSLVAVKMNSSSSSDSSSSQSDSDNSESSLSPACSTSGEEEDDDDDEEDEEVDDGEQKECEGERDNQNQLGAPEKSSEIESLVAGSENEPQPQNSGQNSCKKLFNPEDGEDETSSTCEMVRQMIARRRLRAQLRGAATEFTQTTTATDSDQQQDLILLDQQPSEQSTSENLQEQNLKLQLEKTLNKVSQLEMKLCDSYNNYNQLELSCQRLKLELTRCNELHQDELCRVQSKLEELTRELAANELKLTEAHQKLLQYEQNEFSLKPCDRTDKEGTPSESKPAPTKTTIGYSRLSTTSAKALNWLRASQQMCPSTMASSSSNSSHNQLPPLLLMHHVKHTLAANQQTLGLKLLNHSKQIQRRLNELEHKVDRISTVSAGGCAVGAPQSETPCAGAASLQEPDRAETRVTL